VAVHGPASHEPFGDDTEQLAEQAEECSEGGDAWGPGEGSIHDRSIATPRVGSHRPKGHFFLVRKDDSRAPA
jgi:hypothetical protein